MRLTDKISNLNAIITPWISESRLKVEKKSILIYIPCHTDFDLALTQGEEIRRQIAEIRASNLECLFSKFSLILSVNDFEPSLAQIQSARNIFDEVLLYGKTLLADYNLALGFITSLRVDSDYLWILSTNDKLKNNALSLVSMSFESNLECDLLVFNAIGLNGTHTERNITNPPKAGYWYGLISGVVYKTFKLAPYFNSALFLAWTGWSHLAVLQSAMDGEGGIKVVTIPDVEVFDQGRRDTKLDAQKYMHSYFGEIVIRTLFSPDKKAVKLTIRNFIKSNIFIHHLYSKRDVNTKSYPIAVTGRYGWWNRVIAESMIKESSYSSNLIYRIAKLVPFENLKNNKFVFLFYSKFKRNKSFSSNTF